MRETIPSLSHMFFKRRALSLIIVSIVSVCTVFLLNMNAYAFKLEGPKWAGQPPPHTCCANIYVKQGPATSYDSAAYNYAISAWNNAPADIFFQSGSGEVYTTDTYNSGVTWDGLTNYGYDSNNHFTYANVYLNYYYTVGYPTARIQGIAVHELGHSVGLAHAGGCVIMVADSYTRWYTCKITTPQPDDDDGIGALY